jgi:hypothetical protein
MPRSHRALIIFSPFSLIIFLYDLSSLSLRTTRAAFPFEFFVPDWQHLLLWMMTYEEPALAG